MAKTNTGAKAVKLSKPTHIIGTPYNGAYRRMITKQTILSVKHLTLQFSLL